MALLWAKTNVGTNLAFVKGFGKAIRTWKEVLQQKIVHKVPFRPRERAHERCIPQPIVSSSRPSEKLRTRIFRSLYSRTSNLRMANRWMSRQMSFPSGGAATRGFRTVPLLSLIGVTIGLDTHQIIDGNSEKVMSEMRNMFQDYSVEPEPLSYVPRSLDDLEIVHQSIANGSEGAVFKAKIKPDHSEDSSVSKDEDFDLALKAVFNYGAESDASNILRELHRETVPLNVMASDNVATNLVRSSRLPPHLNIVDMPGMFVDDMLVTEEGLHKFPAALPRSVNPDLCFGRNKTLYLVMRRRTSHLGDYLSKGNVTMATRCLILAQLLEGVSHLVRHGVAHRDLKANNILVQVPKAGGAPKVEICDFGCCLAEESKSLKVNFNTRDLFIGGNSWLMAPEIATAQPGPNAVLDFSKMDVWAAGAIAYEILGAENPFYPCRNNSRKQLSNVTYDLRDLPDLPEDVPGPVKRLVKALLCRDPMKRPSASVAATVMHMVAIEMNTDQPKGTGPKFQPQLITKPGKAHVARVAWEKELFRRVLVQALAMLCQLTFGAGNTPGWTMESVTRFLFLSRLNYQDFRMALRFF